MLSTELKLPFPWYTAIEKQHRFRPQNLIKEPYPLIAPNNSLLPFQIKRPQVSDSITEWKIYDLNGVEVADITASVGTLISVACTGIYEYIIYNGGVISGLTLANGCYYASLTKGGSTFYSEVFKVVDNISEYIKLTWKHTCDIDPVVYQTGFVNVIYIDSYTEAIPAEINEEGEENGAGEFIPTLQRIVHKHKIEFFAADFLLDALSFMQIHDTINIVEGSDNAQISRVKTVPVFGDYATGNCRVEFELPGDYVVSPCCKNIALVDCSGGGGGCVAVAISDETLSDAVVGAFYEQFISLTGDSPFTSFTWLTAPPAWLTGEIAGSQVRLYGTPTSGDEATGVPISFSVTNCEGANTDVFSTMINVQAAGALYASLVRTGDTLAVYVEGGLAPYTYTFSCTPSGPCNDFTIDNPVQTNSLGTASTLHSVIAYTGASYVFVCNVTDSLFNTATSNTITEAPCLIPSTLITIRRGEYKRLYEIKVGDILFDSKVMSVEKYVVPKLYSINKNLLQGSANHVNILQNGSLVENEHLKVGDILIGNIKVESIDIQEGEFDVINISTDTGTFIANGVRTHNKVPC